MLDIFLGLIDTMPVQADFMRVSIGKMFCASLMLLMMPCFGSFSPYSHSLDATQKVAYHSDGSNNSVNFTTSGGSGLAISGEPAHVGDPLGASVMVTNSGNSTASVSLHISSESDEVEFQGEYVLISPGSTREVIVSFILTSSGPNNLHWWLSVEGVPDNFPFEGNLSIEVSPSQLLQLSLQSIDWTNTDGLNIEASIYLSDGRSREITLAASSSSQGLPQYLQSIELEADPGRRTINFHLGHPSADTIIIEAIPIGWQPSPESANVSQESVQEPIVEKSSITIEAIFNPNNPTPGSKTMASISLENSGENQAHSGKVRVLMSSDLTILAETEVQSVMPGSKVTTDISIPNWPETERVELEVQWSTSGVTVSSYYSVETNLDDQGLQLPFDIVAAGFGALGGVLTILIGTLVWRAISNRTPSTSDLRLRETKESIETISRQEKKEIQCSYCDQRLMVPHDHAGGVRCPSCTMEFVVGESENHPHPVVRTSEDTLNCPDCDQALRVKMENRPVMSRCPVCKTHFMAEAEGI
jgi:hypothetical protein